MTVEERERRLLQEALMGSIGPDSTDTLMGYLPPVGWAEVATKGDLRTLETVLRAEMGSMEHGLREEISSLRAEIRGELRNQFYWLATLIVLLLTAFAAVLKLS